MTGTTTPETTDVTLRSPHSRSMMRIWRGLGLPNWIRLIAQRPALLRADPAGALSLTVTSALNSALNLAESIVWGRRIQQTEIHPQPLFILGHWRSGTTLLHNLLARDPQFAFLNLYEALFPGHFLLTERWLPRFLAPSIPPTRPMDDVPLDWRLPQEDEAALLLMTLCSPYLAAAFPDLGGTLNRLANPSRLTPSEKEQWTQAFLTLLRKVTLAAGRRPLLLKSPPHTSRIPLLRELFPAARFVYLVRNPYEVYASTLRLHRSMYALNRLVPTEPRDLENQVLDGYLQMYQAYHLHRALLAPAQRYEMRYEDLVSDPVDATRRLYEHLGIAGFDRMRPEIEARLPEHRRHQAGGSDLSHDEMIRVYDHWQPAFRRYGYPSLL